jgi:hypothetical protein
MGWGFRDTRHDLHGGFPPFLFEFGLLLHGAWVEERYHRWDLVDILCVQSIAIAFKLDRLIAFGLFLGGLGGMGKGEI